MFSESIRLTWLWCFPFFIFMYNLIYSLLRVIWSLLHELWLFQVSSTSPSSYLGQLTSLRFFAAIGIFVLHARNHNLIPSDFLFSLNLSNCVSFFFVLSGFIIAYAYDGRSYVLSAFYKSRFSRIWPAAAFSTLMLSFSFQGYTSQILIIIFYFWLF